MTVVLAIDPGPVRSAWVVVGHPHDDGDDKVLYFETERNDELITRFREWYDVSHVVIEKVESFGMAVGAEVFETVYWSGRFAEAAFPRDVDRIGRKAVKIHLCGTTQAKDSNVRQALIDRYGGSKAAAIGLKRTPGPLYGVSGDVWSALAVAVTWQDRQRQGVR